MNSRQQDRIKRTVRKSMATIQGRFDEANLGPVEVSIDWHCREVESEWGWDSIWRHRYGWYCWSDRWLIRVTVHPSSEARRQEAQVFHPNRLPAFLPLQHPASTQGAMASHSGCSQQRGRRATSDQQGLKVIYGHHAQTPPSPGKLWVHPVGPASCDLHMFCARSLPSVSHRDWARACGHNRPEKPLCQQIWQCTISSSLSLSPLSLWLTKWTLKILIISMVPYETPRKIQWHWVPVDAQPLHTGRGNSLHMYEGQTKIGNVSKVVASFCNQLL